MLAESLFLIFLDFEMDSNHHGSLTHDNRREEEWG